MLVALAVFHDQFVTSYVASHYADLFTSERFCSHTFLHYFSPFIFCFTCESETFSRTRKHGLSMF